MKIAKSVNDYYDNELQSMMKILYERLSEDNRRLLAAIESKRIGHRGIFIMSTFFGCSRPTIYKGLRELENPSTLTSAGDIRSKGAGRKDAFTEHPELKQELDEILKDNIAGDPMNEDVVWTHLNARQIQEKLEEKGIKITLPTVRVAVKKTLGQTESSKKKGPRKQRRPK